MKLRSHSINANASFKANSPKLCTFLNFLLFFLVLGQMDLKGMTNSVA